MVQKREESIRDSIKEEVKLSLTPMIDVTFLLLIFFMCSIKFKMLEGKLAAYLPKRGITPSAQELLTEEISVLLQKKQGKTEFLISGARKRGIVPDDLGILYSAVRTLYTRMRDTQPKVSCVIQVGEKVKHGHVVACLNELMRAGLQDIAFSRTR